MKIALMLIPFLGLGCARTFMNYPPQVDQRTGKLYAARAIELNGSDSLGATEIEVTNHGVRYVSAGGIDNSTSTKEGYRTVRHGVTAATTVATAAYAYGAYAAQQAASSASNTAASRAAGAAAVSKNATTVKLAEIAAQEKAAQAAAQAAGQALPAAGSTINAVTPATVVPVP